MSQPGRSWDGMKTKVFWMVLLLSVGPAGTPGHAQEPSPTTQPSGATSEARRLFEEGLANYASGEFHQAIKLLRAAATKTGDPTLLGRIHAFLGANYYVTNQRQKAKQSFIRALKHNPMVQLQVKQVGESILGLLESTRKVLTGQLDVSAPRPKMLVKIDGQHRGEAPWSGRLPIGAHRLYLHTADNTWTCEAQVVVKVDATTRASCEPKQP